MKITFFKTLALLAVSAVGLPSQAETQAQTQTTPSCVFTLAGGAKPQCHITQIRAALATTTAPLSSPAAQPAPLLAVAVAPAPASPLTLTPPPEPAPAPEPPPAIPSPSWDLSLKDVTLAEAMTRWAKTAGWRVLWDLDKHILIDSPDVYRGSFEQVVTAVLSSPGLANGPYPLEVCFYPNTPPLARITRRGMQGKDCK